MVDPDYPLVRKVLWRLIPFCILCFLLNYIDRVNISIAKLKMVEAIPGFTASVYATGAGIFFLGYFLFELPSNLIQQRVGPRRWIARIMITWGVISICFVLVRGPFSFYFLRFLLGFAEAGFFPGVILYLSHWVPQRYRARASALFLTSTAISGVIGNPLGGTILYWAEKHPFWLESWQWLFLIEGLPSVVLGVVTLVFLTDRPGDAGWLTAAERGRLEEILEGERAAHPAGHLSELRDAFRSGHTWMLSALYGLVVFGFYTVNFYTPTIIKEALVAAGAITKETPGYRVFFEVGVLSAIPFGAAAVAMVVIARSSDRRGGHARHFAFACLLIAVGLGVAG
ncbi:MAG: MFS transporter, partial [Phycisphaerae bacterium]